MLNEADRVAPSDEAFCLTEAGRRYFFPLEFPTSITVSRAADYLTKGILPARALAVLYGQPGSGKSFLALDAALHVAAGRLWAGCKVRGDGVVYVAAEAGRGMRKRTVAALRRHGIDPALPSALLTVAPDLGRREGDAEALAREILAQVPTRFNPHMPLREAFLAAFEAVVAELGAVYTRAAVLVQVGKQALGPRRPDEGYVVQ